MDEGPDYLGQEALAMLDAEQRELAKKRMQLFGRMQQMQQEEDEEDERSDWKRGTKVEVWSNSANRWFPGVIAKVQERAGKVVVQYRTRMGKGGTMQKILPRYSETQLRPRQAPTNPVSALAAALQGLSYE